jgi:hypothetical protein
MVEEHEVLDLGRQRKIHRLLDGGVPPADLSGVLGAGVLGVVDQHVRAAQERHMGTIGRVQQQRRIVIARRAVRPPQRAGMRLVIQRVDQRDAARVQPVSQAGRGVVELVRAHPHAANREVAFA